MATKIDKIKPYHASTCMTHEKCIHQRVMLAIVIIKFNYSLAQIMPLNQKRVYKIDHTTWTEQQIAVVKEVAKWQHSTPTQ